MITKTTKQTSATTNTIIDAFDLWNNNNIILEFPQFYPQLSALILAAADIFQKLSKK